MDQTDKAIPPKTRPLTFTMVFTGLAGFIGGSFLFGWNITCLSVPAPYIKAFMNESAMLHYGSELGEDGVNFLFSLAILLYTVGGAIGAFFAGKLADHYGRKKSVLLMQTVAILGGVCYGICQLAGSFELLMAARFFVGLGAGACFAIVPMYANEIAPVHLRGSVAACSQLFITIGIFTATTFVLEDTLGSESLWPIGAAGMLIFSVLSILMFLMPWSVESPKWLLNVKKDGAAAREIVEKLYNGNDVDEVIAEMKEEGRGDSKSEEKEEAWGYIRLFQTSYLRWPVIFVVSLNAAQQCSGINVVFFFADSLYKGAGLEGKEISYAALFVSAVNVLATIVSIWLIDKLGRRPLLIFPMAGMILMMILEVAFLFFVDRVAWLSYACIATMIIYVICFAVGLGPIPLFIGSEVLRPEPRASAMALGGVVNLVGTLLVALLFENVLNRFLGKLSFVPFIVLTFMFLILFAVKLPETKNRTITDIYRELGVNESSSGGATRPTGAAIEMEEGHGLLHTDKKDPIV